MRRIGVLVLLMVMASIWSCASARGPGAPLPKVALNPGETLAIDSKIPLIFYEKLNIKDLPERKMQFSINGQSAVRNDKISQEVSERFKKKLAEFLRERGVEVYPGAPVKTGLSMALGSKTVSSSTLLALGAFYSIEIDSVLFLKIFVYTSVVHESSVEPPATDYEKLATRLAELTANNLVTQMRKRDKLSRK